MPAKYLSLASLAVLLGTLVSAAPAGAQWAVFDGAAVGQLVQQASYWQQQIRGMQSQIQQLNQQYAAVTGTRGMQQLLPLTALQRNYLPTSVGQLQSVMNGAGGIYSGLGAAQTQAVTANAVLTPAALAGLSATDRQLLVTRRNNAALLQTLTQSALQQTSIRFSTLQTLISQIGVATDPKAIADLQGRVQVEQAMLENDNAKLSSLYQLIRAQELVANQQAAEAAVARVGRAAALPAVTY